MARSRFQSNKRQKELDKKKKKEEKRQRKMEKKSEEEALQSGENPESVE